MIISTRLKKNKKRNTKKNKKKKQDEEQEEKTITDANVFNEQINKEEKNINNELFKKHFKFQNPSAMLKFLNDLNNIEKSNKLVDVNVGGLKDLKKEI